MGNQTHSLVRVAVHWQLNQTNNLLVGAVNKVLTRAFVCHIQKLQFRDFTAISWSQSSAARVSEGGIPQLHLVLVVSCEDETFVEIDVRVPNERCWFRLQFYLELVKHWQLSAQLRILYVVLKAVAVCTDTEETVHRLVIGVNRLSEAETCDFNFVCADFAVKDPLAIRVFVSALIWITLKQTDAMVGVRSRKVLAIITDNKVDHRWSLVIGASQRL